MENKTRKCLICQQELSMDSFMGIGKKTAWECLDCCQAEFADAWHGHTLSVGFNLTQKMVCVYCEKRGSARLYKVELKNGTYQVRAWCANCYRKGSRNLKHELLTQYEIEIESIPTLQKNEGLKCAVNGCASYYTENHHFAPRHLFGIAEANLWPQSPLCKTHHKKWHDTVTPDMYRR